MMKQILFGGQSDALNVTNIEYNLVLGGSTWSVTENSRTQCVSTPGTIDSLYVELTDDPGTSPDAYTFTLRKNGADTTLTCTITANDTSGSDVVHSVAVVAGDVIDIKCEPLNSPSVAPAAQWVMRFTGTNAAESLILGHVAAVETETRYTFVSVGNPASSTTENDFRQVCPTAGTIKNLYANLSADPGTSPDAYTFTLRKNGADTLLACTIVANNVAGSDTTHGIAVVAGDVLTLSVAPVSTPSATPRCAFGFTFLASIDGESLILGGSYDDLSNADTEYNRIGASNRNWSTVEGDLQALGLSCVLRKLYVLLSAAPGSGNTYTFTPRVNAGSPADGLSVAITGTATTGNDTTHAIHLTAGDNVALMVVPDSTPDVADAYWGLVCYTGVIADAASAIAAATSVSALSTQVVPGLAAINAVLALVEQAAGIFRGASGVQGSASLTTVGNLVAGGETGIEAGASVGLDGDAIFSGVVAANVAAVLEIIASEINLVRAWADLGITTSLTPDGDLVASGKAAVNAAAALAIIANRLRSCVVGIDSSISVAALQTAVRSAIWAANVAAAVTTDADAVMGGASGIEASAGVGLDADGLMAGIAALAATAGIAPNGDAIFSGVVAANVAVVLEIIASEINLIRAWADLGITVGIIPDADVIAAGIVTANAAAGLVVDGARTRWVAAQVGAVATLAAGGAAVMDAITAVAVAASLLAPALRIRGVAADVQVVAGVLPAPTRISGSGVEIDVQSVLVALGSAILAGDLGVWLRGGTPEVV